MAALGLAVLMTGAGTVAVVGWERSAWAASTTASGPEGQQLTVSKSAGLKPAGETVTVTGSGFDLNKGIYVVFCVNRGKGQQPTPCLGGVDLEGASGSSAWISSNPPSYGEGLAKPFEEVNGKGSFTVSLKLAAKDQYTNCLDPAVAPQGCVVGTRADHTRTADRSADVLVPVTFATTTPTPTTKPATTPGDDRGPSLASTGAAIGGVALAALALLSGGAVLIYVARRRTG